jgi:hypothetical protein
MRSLRRIRFLAVYAAVLSIAADKEPRSLPTKILDQGGPPVVRQNVAATQVSTVGHVCREFWRQHPLKDADAKQLEQLATDLDAVSIWFICEDVADPPRFDDFNKVRIELRNAGARGARIKLLEAETVLPIVSSDRREAIFLVDVKIRLHNEHGVDIGPGAKALGLNTSAGFKTAAIAPGVYPKG